MNGTSKDRKSTQVLDPTAVLAALESDLSMIEFNLNKEVIWVNDNFAAAMGYNANEMIGMRHKQFCTLDFSESAAYVNLWNDLSRGKKFQEKI